MNNEYIGVLDSGIGGLSLLKLLTNLLPNEKFVYLGDSFNSPYGNKSIRELREITLNNIINLQRYKLKALVFACNTLSMSLRKEMQEICDYKIYGVFPPVEKFLLKGEKILLLSTTLTAKYFNQDKNLSIIGLKHLAKDIENNIDRIDNIKLERFLTTYDYQRVIFGCTHYYFAKKIIISHFYPPKITFGEQFCAKMMKRQILNNKKPKIISKNQAIFIGNNAKKIEEVWLKVVKK